MLSKTGEPLKLTWEVVVRKFENLVKFAAGKQVRTHKTDTMVSAEDLYQEGMIKLYDCWNIWCVDKNKDMDEFAPIFRKSLFRHMSKGGTSSKARPVCVDLEDEVLENMTYCSAEENTIEKMYLEKGLSELRDILTNEIAKKLLDELIEPSPQTLFQVWADLKRKETIKAQGKRVNIPKDTTVRMKHIMRALGITIKQYDIAMSEIREKAGLALDYSF